MAERIIVGVSGASGAVMSRRLLMALKEAGTEIHLVMSQAAKLTWNIEAEDPIEELYTLADYTYEETDYAALIASGSYVTSGMIIMPCSMKTLAGIVSGYAENLLLRAADVCLKEGRKVVLVPREMPLGRVHLRNLLEASELGCAVIPPMLTFYNHAGTLEEQIDHVVGKVLLQFGLGYEKFHAWQGKEDKW